MTDTMNAKVEVLVQDTGTGISPENIKKIYDPFFTTKAPGKGTGLGLSVSYGIVQEHGGTISVESRPGVGTTFRLELPMVRKTVNV
jgi:two-component system NtrC family sensor kinase